MRHHQLDSLRGLAALSVFFSHYLGIITFTSIGATQIFNIITNSPLHILWDGHSAVILFFVLSGFVLSFPYVSDKSNKLKIVQFLIKRVLRIYPAYLASLILCIFLKTFFFNTSSMAHLSDWINSFWHWKLSEVKLSVFLKYAFMIGPQFDYNLINPVTWTLIVEMRISLIFPLVILILQKFDSLTTYIFLFVSVIVFIKIGKIGTMYYLPFFIIGAIIAKYNSVIYMLLNSNFFLKKIAFVLSVIFYTCMFSLYFVHIPKSAGDYLIGLGVSIVLVLSLNDPAVSKFLKKPNLVELGNFSYSFYLLHFGILITASSLMLIFLNYNVVTLILICITSLSLSLVLSFLSFSYIEKVFIKIGKKICHYRK